jgi:PGF-CTERM protein
MFDRTRGTHSAVVALGVVAALVAGLAALGTVPVGADETADGTGPVVDATADGATLLQAGTADGRITSGTNYWQGQELFFNGTIVVENEIGEPVRDGTPSQRTFELREIEDGRVGDLVTQFVVDRDGHATLNVTDRTGRLAILYQGDLIRVTGGVGRVEGAIGSGSVAESQWEVSEQTLAVAFEDGSVRRGTREDVTIESNRGSYFVRISSPTLDDEALAALWGSRVVERNAREDYVVIRGQGAETLTLRPSSAVPYGTHEFRFRVNDSLAATNATLQVRPSQQTTARATTGTPTTVTATDEPTTAGPTTDGTATVTPTSSGPTTAAQTETTTAATTTTEPVTYIQGTTAGTGPGFGVPAAVLALLGTALLARRR